MEGLRQKNGTREKAADGEIGMKGYLGPLGLLALALCVAAASSLSGNNLAILDYERLTRYTARASFLFFLPVFTLSALSHFLRHPAVLALRPRRRQLGITFGIAHLCHFGAILLFHQHQGTWFTADDSAALLIYALLGRPGGHLKHACGPHPRETVAPYPLGGELRALCGLFCDLPRTARGVRRARLSPAFHSR